MIGLYTDGSGCSPIIIIVSRADNVLFHIALKPKVIHHKVPEIMVFEYGEKGKFAQTPGNLSKYLSTVLSLCKAL